ncbi:MAG: 4-alpha-glucanotransferase, partial [Acidobacteriota bacterium]
MTGGRLAELARLHGIQPAYRDAFGHRREASRETLLALLRTLGVPVESSADVPALLESRREELERRPAEPVAVAWEGRLELPVRFPSPGGAPETVGCELQLEGGGTRRWRLAPERGPGGTKESGEPRHVLRLPGTLPLGYHRLHLELDRGSADVLVLAAPRRAFGSERDPTAPREPRAWGVFLPLHALRTARSWGTGDLTDLARLTGWVAGAGGGMVGTLPLYASFLGAGREPFEPSPYAPASRLFWNELYADPEAAPELERSKLARELLGSTAFREELADLRNADLVDYRQAMRVKRRVLRALAEAAFEDGGVARRAELEAFVREHPELEDYAAFRARTERDGPWGTWGGRPDEVDPDSRHYHLYVQWLVHSQMGALAAVYLDLPLGVHPDSYDLWRHRELFAEGVSAGAPPDPFFSRGQSWGFPPLHPERQRAEGYAHLRRVLSTAMEASGVLRIDHVMALHRLFWVPSGHDATEGAYVRYPAEEL